VIKPLAALAALISALCMPRLAPLQVPSLTLLLAVATVLPCWGYLPCGLAGLPGDWTPMTGGEP
jgi:hypothetical protein